MIQYRILSTKIIRIAQQTVRRITYVIIRVKGLRIFQKRYWLYEGKRSREFTSPPAHLPDLNSNSQSDKFLLN